MNSTGNLRAIPCIWGAYAHRARSNETPAPATTSVKQTFRPAAAPPPSPLPPARHRRFVFQTQSAIFPETICKAGWTKEEAVDHLFKKAGYWKPRSFGSSTVNGPGAVDPAVARSVVLLRFQTISFRMSFRKYQRVRERECFPTVAGETRTTS